MAELVHARSEVKSKHPYMEFVDTDSYYGKEPFQVDAACKYPVDGWHSVNSDSDEYRNAFDDLGKVLTQH